MASHPIRVPRSRRLQESLKELSRDLRSGVKEDALERFIELTQDPYWACRVPHLLGFLLDPSEPESVELITPSEFYRSVCGDKMIARILRTQES